MLLAVLITLGAGSDIDRARGLYQQMKYDQALKSLAGALSAPGVESAERAQIYLYTGLCRHQLGDEKGAFEAFKEALSIDATLELPAMTSPKAKRAWERAKAEAVPPPAPPKEEPPPKPVEPVAVAPPQIVEQPPPPPPPPPKKKWWPTVLTSVVAAGAGGTAAYFGVTSQRTRATADMQMFASDGYGMTQTAQTQALVANILFAVAGGALIVAVLTAILL